MSGKPKNFSQAIDEIENGGAETKGNGGFRAHLESELHKLEETLNKIKPHIEELTEKAGSEAKKAKDKVETQVKENPWAAIGIVGLVFFVLGFLFAFKGNRRD
jgi:ElaB/YqjD/DUF883 family membrane-anchored ribosome-binding protein